MSKYEKKAWKEGKNAYVPIKDSEYQALINEFEKASYYWSNA